MAARWGVLVACALAVSLALASSAKAQPGIFEWQRVQTKDAPSGRISAAMVHDAREDRVVLFGGYSGNFLGDTWSYDPGNATWTELFPAVGPTSRAYAASAYDSRTDRVFLFGGLGVSYQVLRDLWEFDLRNDTWTNMTAAQGPPARDAAAMAYDRSSDRIVLFGGIAYPTNVTLRFFNDTWLFDPGSGTWTNATSGLAPPLLAYAHLAYDATGRRDILLGEDRRYCAWSFESATRSWTNDSPAWSPGPYYDVSGTFDSADRMVILLGRGGWFTYPPAIDSGAATWGFLLSNGTWVALGGTTAPSPYIGASMTFDPKDNETILFSGTVLPEQNATWILAAPLPADRFPWQVVGLSMAIGGAAAITGVAVLFRLRSSGRKTGKTPP